MVTKYNKKFEAIDKKIEKLDKSKSKLLKEREELVKEWKSMTEFLKHPSLTDSEKKKKRLLRKKYSIWE